MCVYFNPLTTPTPQRGITKQSISSTTKSVDNSGVYTGLFSSREVFYNLVASSKEGGGGERCVSFPNTDRGIGVSLYTTNHSDTTSKHEKEKNLTQRGGGGSIWTPVAPHLWIIMCAWWIISVKGIYQAVKNLHYIHGGMLNRYTPIQSTCRLPTMYSSLNYILVCCVHGVDVPNALIDCFLLKWSSL